MLAIPRLEIEKVTKPSFFSSATLTYLSENPSEPIMLPSQNIFTL